MNGAEGGGSGAAAPPSMTRETRERLRRRDPQAMAELFDRYFGEIYSVVHRLLGDTAAAEDVTQELFLKVHRSLETYDPSRDPVPWLMTIAYNLCRDHWRSRGHKMGKRSQPLAPGEPIAEVLSADGPPPDGDLIRRERERMLATALRSLPEEQRTIVLLHDYQGLKHEEIAEIVGATAVAVRKRYSRALRNLQEELKDKDIGR
ncbi:MAG: sigma-70 family RNA polymerase sigma factor [Candidatus Eisenbacteria bacterium]|nr:sigma-70 family RNA polymerase sigma factor [Candidatus Latescibacterota bacterium]MBD3301699.1 sigma-70 family RNA polymerase sigma factor [Candidatus Eisenbacteria bacterium]